MAATVEVDESNGSVETVTHAIAHSRYGSVDQANLEKDVNPIDQGLNSFEKWKRFHVVLLGGAAKIKGLRYYALAAPPPNTEHRANVSASQATYDTIKKTAYTQPATTILVATQTVPTSKPSSANLGIGGSLTGEIIAAGGLSDYLVTQIRAGATAQAGGTLTAIYHYDEVLAVPLAIVLKWALYATTAAALLGTI